MQVKPVLLQHLIYFLNPIGARILFFNAACQISYVYTTCMHGNFYGQLKKHTVYKIRTYNKRNN